MPVKERFKTPEYRAWGQMLNRCYGANNRDRHSYGGRGITVCSRWRDSFEDFYADVGPRPSASHSLDRFPNNDGNYEPGNVRWATTGQQSRNTRRNHYLELNGRRMVMEDWASELGFTKGASILRRLQRGWPLEKALTTKKQDTWRRFNAA